VAAEYQMDDDGASDLYSRYYIWGIEKNWLPDDGHTIEAAIYKLRSLMSRDRAARINEATTLLGEGPSDDASVDPVDMMTVLATRSSAATLADMVDVGTDEEYAERLDRLHLLTERQREVIIAYLETGSQEETAALLGVSQQAVAKILAAAMRTLEADNPDPEPHTWEPHDEHPQWCRPGYRQRTPWYDANEDDYCAQCRVQDRDAIVASMQRRDDVSREEVTAFRAGHPARFFGHVHHCNH